MNASRNAMAVAEPATRVVAQEKLLACVRHLPSLPTVATELLQSMDAESQDTETLAQKIAKDPALAADTLRLANSSFYGLGRKVGNLHDAILVLGLRQLRALVVTAAVVRGVRSPGEWFNIKGFWRHSLGVALCAGQLAHHSHVAPDRAYLAGLLHDIGRLALATCFPAEVREMQAYRSHYDCYVFEAERDVLGLDHTDAGRVLARHWHFPVMIQDAIGSHHAPEAEESTSLAGLIHVADAMAHALDLGHEEDDMVPLLSAVAWNRLDLAWPEFAMHLAKVEEAHSSMISLLLPG
ncbi:MAG: HDOD domain-containing protein [Rhodocyclaceae bacterium]|nr:HDOD domain-containing protein [Rhodocyclaceae bacterium]